MKMSSSFLPPELNALKLLLMHVPFYCHPPQLISSVSIISLSLSHLLQKFFIKDHHLEGSNYETPESTAPAANHCHLAEGVSLSKRGKKNLRGASSIGRNLFTRAGGTFKQGGGLNQHATAVSPTAAAS